MDTVALSVSADSVPVEVEDSVAVPVVEPDAVRVAVWRVVVLTPPMTSKRVP